MILPIVSYGNKILRSKTTRVTNISEYTSLIEDMWETMYAAKGIGLAAPQVSKNLNLFIIDSKTLYENLTTEGRRRYWGDEGIQETFINAEILEYATETWLDKEACLSFPSIVVDVERPVSIRIKYQDKHGHLHIKTFGGMTARMIQHEYDHINGILHIDHLRKSYKPMFYNMKLERIKKGKVRTKYQMRFAK